MDLDEETLELLGGPGAWMQHASDAQRYSEGAATLRLGARIAHSKSTRKHSTTSEAHRAAVRRFNKANAPKLRAKARDRYRTDPTYRARVLASMKRYNAKRRGRALDEGTSPAKTAPDAIPRSK